MENEFKKTKYLLEVYEDSFLNDPSYYVDSLTPFTTISVGDYFHPGVTNTWSELLDSKSEKFVIKEIEHIIFSHKSHNSHKMMIIVEKVPYKWSKKRAL